MDVAEAGRLADWRVRHQSSIDEARYNARVFFKDKLAVIGLAIILFTIAVALLGPYIAPYPAQGRGDSHLSERLQAPSAKHIMGTDNYGRDVLSRVIYGARIPLVISFVVTAAIVLIGVPIGGIAGYFGGKLDEVVMRICDVFLAFPSLILAIVFVAFLGPSIRNAMIAIIISWWPRLFLGWGHPVYLALIYFVGPVLLVVIFRRRLKRMNEGLDHSKSIIDATQKAREEAEKATQNAKRKTQK